MTTGFAGDPVKAASGCQENPFRDSVARPWESRKFRDIETIHGAVSDHLIELAHWVGQGHRTKAVLIRGDAGTGKTHLLDRVRRKLRGEAVFAYIEPFGDGRRFHQHVLRKIVENLRRAHEGSRYTQLQELLGYVMAKILIPQIRSADLRERLINNPLYILQLLNQERFRNLLPRILATISQQNPQVDVTFLRVLATVLDRDPENQLLAVQWLQGVDLDEGDLNSLGVRSSAASEDQAKEIIISIGALSTYYRPMVICFDQLEALPAVDGRPGIVELFTRLSELYDRVRNWVLVITCLSAKWKEYESQISSPAKDRLAKDRFLLHSLRPDQIRAVIESRLETISPEDPCRHRFESDQRLETLIEELSSLPSCSVRRVLDHCAEKWDEIAGKPPELPLPLEQFLEVELQERLEAARANLGEPPADEGLMQRTLEIIFEAHRQKAHPLDGITILDVQTNPNLRYVDLLIKVRSSSSDISIGFSMCNTLNAKSFSAHPNNLLKFMAKSPALMQRGFLVRDERVPPRKTWTQGLKYLKELEAKGGSLLSICEESLAYFKALKKLVDDALAGGLLYEGSMLNFNMIADYMVNKNVAERISAIRDLVDLLKREPSTLAQDIVKTLKDPKLLGWDQLEPHLSRKYPKITKAQAVQAAMSIPDQLYVLDPEGKNPVFGLRVSPPPPRKRAR